MGNKNLSICGFELDGGLVHTKPTEHGMDYNGETEYEGTFRFRCTKPLYNAIMQRYVDGKDIPIELEGIRRKSILFELTPIALGASVFWGIVFAHLVVTWLNGGSK